MRCFYDLAHLFKIPGTNVTKLLLLTTETKAAVLKVYLLFSSVLISTINQLE